MQYSHEWITFNWCSISTYTNGEKTLPSCLLTCPVTMQHKLALNIEAELENDTDRGYLFALHIVQFISRTKYISITNWQLNLHCSWMNLRRQLQLAERMRRQLNGSIRAEHEKCTMQMQMQPLPIIKFIYLLSLVNNTATCNQQPASAAAPLTDADTFTVGREQEQIQQGIPVRQTEIEEKSTTLGWLPSPSELGQHQVGHNESNHKTNGQKKLHKSWASASPVLGLSSLYSALRIQSELKSHLPLQWSIITKSLSWDRDRCHICCPMQMAIVGNPLSYLSICFLHVPPSAAAAAAVQSICLIATQVCQYKQVMHSSLYKLPLSASCLGPSAVRIG